MFEDRERAYEAKFGHEGELAFKIRARCHKLFGLWAARRLGCPDAEAYAHGLVVEFEPGRDPALRRRVAEDLAAAGVPASPEEIEVAFEAAALQARRQIMAEG
jgi:hypothetical protein